MEYTKRMGMRRTSRTYRLDPDLVAALEDVKERDGVPVSIQVRRAIREWLERRGALKAERPRVTARKRS